MQLTLSELFTFFLEEKGLYALIASRLRRVLKPGIGTMAVGIEKGRIVLFVDPEFLKDISLPFGLYVLEHEMMHIVLDHLPRFFELLAQVHDEAEQAKAKAVYNVAMDCADNSMLRKSKYFPVALREMREWVWAKQPGGERADKDGLILPENHDLPVDKGFEFYQYELMSRVQTIDMTVEAWGHNGLDQHQYWADTKDPRTPEDLKGEAQQIRTQAKQVLREAVREFEQAHGRGTLPEGVQEWLTAYLADPIVPWWEVLTSRILATKQSKRDRGIMRPNRTLLAIAEEDASIIPSIGVSRDPKYRVFYVEDTSGSMDTDSLRIGRSELTHLLKADEDMEVRHIQGDAAIHFDRVYHSGDEVTGEVLGRGGTDFDAYFIYMSQYFNSDDTAPDLVIVHTDGYAPSVESRNRLPLETPVIWLLTRGGSADSLAGYGEVIHADPEHNNLYKEQK